MRLPRAIQLDSSDRQVFERPCEPGEWAIPGSFAFAGPDPTQLQGKAQIAFKSAWLGLTSFGHTTLVEVAEIEEADLSAAIDRLARHLQDGYGAPDLDLARAAARHELEDAASLCDHKIGTLLTLERQPGDEGIVERIRVVQPARASDHAKIWEIVPDNSGEDTTGG